RKVNMASNGNGGLLHLAGELFKMMTGIDLVHVPYRGAQPALTDVISGQVQVMFAASTVEYIKRGKVRALAVTTPTRSEVLPDVPPLSEFVPGYDAAAWIGVGAPKNTPPEIIDKLNKEINAALGGPQIEGAACRLGQQRRRRLGRGLREAASGGSRKVGQSDPGGEHQSRVRLIHARRVQHSPTGCSSPLFEREKDSTLVAWYRSPYAPRTGGAHDIHLRTAGIAGCTWRRGGGVAARGARAAADDAGYRVPQHADAR